MLDSVHEFPEKFQNGLYGILDDKQGSYKIPAKISHRVIQSSFPRSSCGGGAFYSKLVVEISGVVVCFLALSSMVSSENPNVPYLIGPTEKTILLLQ